VIKETLNLHKYQSATLTTPFLNLHIFQAIQKNHIEPGLERAI
jgi:hypothetical protein